MKTVAIKQLLKYSEFATEQVILNAIHRIIDMEEVEEDGLSINAAVSHVLAKEVKHPKAFARQYLTSRVSRDIYIMEDGKPMMKRYFIDTVLPEIVMHRCVEIREIGLQQLRELRAEIMEIYREQFQ